MKYLFKLALRTIDPVGVGVGTGGRHKYCVSLSVFDALIGRPWGRED